MADVHSQDLRRSPQVEIPCSAVAIPYAGGDVVFGPSGTLFALECVLRRRVDMEDPIARTTPDNEELAERTACFECGAILGAAS